MFAAKLVAKKKAGNHPDKVVVRPRSAGDLAGMEAVLRLKLGQHPALRELLPVTGREEIVEDCTRRPGGSGLFWGAALRGGAWVGENRLGRLWMRLRDELAGPRREGSGAAAPTPPGSA